MGQSPRDHVRRNLSPESLPVLTASRHMAFLALASHARVTLVYPWAARLRSSPRGSGSVPGQQRVGLPLRPTRSRPARLQHSHWLESRRRYRSADCGACWLPLHPTRTRIRSIRLGLGYGPPSSGSATVWLHSSVVDPAPGHASGGASELPQSAPSDSDTARSAPAQVGPGPQLPSRPTRIRPARLRISHVLADSSVVGPALVQVRNVRGSRRLEQRVLGRL